MKPWYKRWKVWGGVFVVLVVIGLFAPNAPEETTSAPKVEAETKPVVAEKSAEDIAKEQAEFEAKNKAEQEAWEKKSADDAAKKAEAKTPAARDVEIRKTAEKYIEKYAGSEIVKIDVNENLGANDGSYLVLVHMAYPRANSAEMSLKMVTMYSEDLAANLASESDVSDVTVFWEVPRFLEGRNAAKFTYKRAGDGMVLDDEMIASELQ